MKLDASVDGERTQQHHLVSAWHLSSEHCKEMSIRALWPMGTSITLSPLSYILLLCPIGYCLTIMTACLEDSQG